VHRQSLCARARAELGADLVDGPEGLRQAGQQALAVRRQDDLPLRAVEQRPREMLLQGANLVADR
jgi:hypothetical protein